MPLPKVGQRLAVCLDSRRIHPGVDHDGTGVVWPELLVGLLQLWALLKIIYEVIVDSLRRDERLDAYNPVNVGEL